MTDYFERLGLPRRFNLEAAEIERQYLARCREAHPDYFQMGGDIERRASVEMSAALNEAYAALRDSFRRAEHLLELEGGPSAAEMKEAPASFLEEMLELRMSIEEIRAAGPDSPLFETMEKDLDNRREKLLNDVGRIFERLNGEDRCARLKEIRQTLNVVKYVQGLRRDLHAD